MSLPVPVLLRRNCQICDGLYFIISAQSNEEFLTNSTFAYRRIHDGYEIYNTYMSHVVEFKSFVTRNKLRHKAE